MNFDAPIRTTPNSKEFRSNLKHYLDMALYEAVRVQRSSGDNFIVIKESNYKAMIHELIHLQRRLLKMAPVFHKGFMESEDSREPKNLRLIK